MRNHAGQRAGPPYRPELGEQQLARGVGQADGPHPQERVGLGGQVEVRDSLVAADVGQPDHHRPVRPEGREYLPIGLDLLLFRRSGLAAHE